MLRFLSTTLGQILTIIATSTAITFVLFLVLLWGFYPSVPPPPPWPWETAYRIISLVDSLRAVPANAAAAVIAAARRPRLSIRLTQAPEPCETLTLNTRDLEAVLKSTLSNTVPDIMVRACDDADPNATIQVLIGWGDQTLDIRTAKVGREPIFRLTFPFIGAVLFLCVGVAGMSAWAVWRVVGPLRRLSERAEAFGRNIAISPIAEEGPLEIRRAARVFNLMQERITRSIQDRTRMLAAIGHDLRTPLTRMRLQLETGKADVETSKAGVMRGKLLRDVSVMEAMVTSALAFLSGAFDGEEKEWLDLGALLSTLCDEYEETGAAVSYEGPGQIRFFCKPNAITRALTNLIENGIQFGERVSIVASNEDDTIRIDIADDGPGIPTEHMQDVVEPFVRLNPSRSDRPGSVGLGLSIVKEIVETHGGALVLKNRQPTGLIASVSFPRASRMRD